MMENQIGFYRLTEVLKIYPVSKSEWWLGVKERRYPAAIRLTKRTTCWRKSDIFALVEKLSGGKCDE